MANRWRLVVLAFAVVAAACGGGGETAEGDDAATSTTTTMVETTTTTTEAPPPPLDLDGDLLLFAPVPPTDGPLPDGAEDFWQLFEDPESWADVAAELDAIKLHGAQFRFGFSNEQIETIIEGLEVLGLPLILEVEPLDHPDPDRCAHNESYEGPYEIDTMRRIKALGGHISAIAIEQPHSYNTLLDTPTACQDTVEETVAQVMDWVVRARSVYPDIPVGSIEGVWSDTTADDYASWLDTYAAMAGEPFAFIHVDIGWTIRPDWPTVVREIEDVADARDVPFGVLWNGNDAALESEWIPMTADRIVEYEQTAGGSPQHTSIQSWVPWPDRVLPADDVGAMANLIHRYAVGTVDVSEPVITADGLTATVSIGGEPAAGMEVVVERTPRGGQVQTVGLDGVVPEGATSALVQVRSNDDYSEPGAADVAIRDIAYVEAGGVGGPVPNGSFDGGMSSWGAYGDGAGGVSSASVDGDSALSLVIDEGAATFVDGMPFAVTVGESYRFDVTFSFSPESARTTTVALIFFDDTAAEFGRDELVVRPWDEEVARAITGADGTVTVGPADAFAGDVDVIVRVPGDADVLGGRWEGSLS